MKRTEQNRTEQNLKLFCITFVLSVLSSPLFAIVSDIKIGLQDSSISHYQQGNFYIDITLMQPIGNLSIYGNYRNEMNKSSLSTFFFSPVQDYYTVGASYTFPFATIRLEHMCMHPVVSHSYWNGLQGGYTRFEIQIGD